MTAVNPPAKPEAASRRFVIELLGFSDVEKAMLVSTFRLTSRRTFSYSEPNNPNERVDLYLANADNAEAITQLQARSPNIHAPAVLIGRNPVNIGWPQVDRPIHWMRLFEQMDNSMQTALNERARRQFGDSDGGGQWDGRTPRRAGDKDIPLPEPVVEAKPTETVLVVDDSATVRAFMRAKLAPFHFDVDYAEDGETAIDMAQAKSYTCIFLDIMMPGIDGYQVCKRIKGNAETKDTAVVMLTSKSSAFDKFRGNWAGCDAYLAKPVGEDELLTTIARFLPGARKIVEAM
jgi:twitching motility two-component system response regulator PilG